MEKPSYINKKGKRIELVITRHARNRLRERWPRLYRDTPLPDDLDAFIAERFSQTTRIKNHSYVEKQRMKKHGKDTIYFRHNDFTFVVKNGAIVTIEISNRGQRHLNKKPLF